LESKLLNNEYNIPIKKSSFPVKIKEALGELSLLLEIIP
jgi:hypothetical protein